MSFNPFSLFQPAETDTNREVGTPERPLDRPRLQVLPNGEIRDAGAVLTGPRARDSWAKISKAWAAKPEADRDAEAFLPRDDRRSRREHDRAMRRERRKSQRAFTRRELAKESAARDLLNLFLLADGKEPTSAQRRNQAKWAIAQRVAYLRGVEQAKYDEQISARQHDRRLPAPSPVRSHEAIEAELRALAATVTLPTPKAQRRESPAIQVADVVRQHGL